MRPIAICDTECYVNYWLFKVYFPATAQYWETEIYPGSAPLNVSGIVYILQNYTLVTFNGINYDMPMIQLACAEATCEALKLASNMIIAGKMRPWEFRRHYGLAREPAYIDHIDVMEVAPGKDSLKAYGARLHSKRLQDLPYDEAAEITPEMRSVLRLYCGNDLLTTLDLFNKVRGHIAIREKISAEFNIDVRSKSDPQVAEAVFKACVGFQIERPIVPAGTTFFYQPPAWMQFQTKALRDVLARVASEPFRVNDKGGVDKPEYLRTLKVPIGDGTYATGIGGLHSTEEETYCEVQDGWTLADIDGTSFYPTLILMANMWPKQIGPIFREIYERWYHQRIDAKQAGRKDEANGLKIFLNGIFGKLGSIWSIFYAPDLLIQTTVTGQLSLLMLIEALELAGVKVLNGNTDGVVTLCPNEHLPVRDAVVKWWETTTGFITEEIQYRGVYSRDVNNYLALKPDGEYKGKGLFAREGGKGSVLDKNPVNYVCTLAIVAFLRDGIPLEVTIDQCQDIREFITARNVAGGAVKGGRYLGKAIRWYYAKGETGDIRYKKNGYLVARSEGARPLMELPDAGVPEDLDREWYVREAYDILTDIGFMPRPPKVKRGKKVEREYA